MKRWGRYIFYILLAGVVIIQFFRPERNKEEIGDLQNDMLTYLEVPPAVAEKLKNACYDCHSNRTKYPWYSQVAPFSWVLARHVRGGKEEMNLTEFGNLEKRKMIGVLSELCEVVDEGSMPLPGYLLMHKEAEFSQEEIEALCEWSEMAALRLLRD
jgi:hypothetical protein